ncbi:MAG: nucleoside hydrolase [Acidimicrobiales bacterium]
MRRFLIDTDTASDDAVAIVMALRAPDVKVEALTVVAGNVALDQAVQNALYTVEICGASVPVYCGLDKPMMRPLENAADIHGADGMGDCGLVLSGRTPTEGRAVDVIVDTILGSPGEITLVCLGPLTNIAAALLRAPEIADAVGRVVVMGGTGVHGPGNVSAMAEYNFWADPEAASLVTGSGMPLEFVGWDISITSAIKTPDRYTTLEAIDTPLSRFAIDVSRAVKRFADDNGMEGDDLPDPIAMAHAIDPSVSEVSRLHVNVMFGDGGQRGVLEIDRMGFIGGEPNVDVVTHYPSDHFFEMLFSSLRGE